MSIGYACLTVGVEGVKFRTCRRENASEENLRKIITGNLQALDKMLDYNIANEIKLLRISSDIIPFASHPVNTLIWQEEFAGELQLIGEKARAHHIRLSMHPGQYTVINSVNPATVKKSVEDLRFHAGFLDALGMDRSNKLILHIGGAYGDKAGALRRFAQNYRHLDKNIRDRLVIENDDRIFNISDALYLGLTCDIPVVYDNLHNAVNPAADEQSDRYWIQQAAQTWHEADGRPKIHYSQQGRGKKPGAHSETIDLQEFLLFLADIAELGPDIMLEVKDKNLSAVKCINGSQRQSIRVLEQEWARYKYLVLEHSPEIYREIRELLKDKNAYPAVAFYRLTDEALALTPRKGNAVNAGQHVWGYFKKNASVKEKERLAKEIDKIRTGGSLLGLKRFLWHLAKSRDVPYLSESLYFKDLM